MRADSGIIAFDAAGARLHWAAAQAAKMAAADCGDGYLFRLAGNRLLVALADGVGSGGPASAAASACLQELSAADSDDLETLFEAAHRRLRGTRGAALALALVDPARETLGWAALGDVEGVICPLDPQGRDKAGIMQKGGTLGVHYPGIHVQQQPFPPDHMLILASDGVSRRFRDAALHSKLQPQDFAASCLAVYGKSHDDRTVLAVTHRRRLL